MKNVLTEEVSFAGLQKPALPSLWVPPTQCPLSKKLRTLSAPSLVHGSYNGIYLGTNESDTDLIAQALNTRSKILEACHIGFSGWHNFDIAYARRSSRIIICDINPENALFLSNMLHLICESASRDDFMERMTEFFRAIPTTKQYARQQRLYPFSINPNINQKPPYHSNVNSEIDELRIEKERTNSWLYSEASFLYIKYLAAHDRIALITQDIQTTACFQKIRQRLQDNGIAIDTVYVSNIQSYMKSPESLKHFEETLRLLVQDNTILIDADSDGRNFPTGLKQRLTDAKDLDSMLSSSVKRNKALSQGFFQPQTDEQAAVTEVQDNKDLPIHSISSTM